ncbi:hypothetical protein [Actinophytocola sp.]|nr:hypothetical protein [Actinophytocola sp.]
MSNQPQGVGEVRPASTPAPARESGQSQVSTAADRSSDDHLIRGYN